MFDCKRTNVVKKFGAPLSNKYLRVGTLVTSGIEVRQFNNYGGNNFDMYYYVVDVG